MYTVSHDATSGKHTVRFETYTSFNMPLEIKYANLGADEIPNAAQTYAKASDRTLSFLYGPEHKHYLQAAGIMFAMMTKREGTPITAASTGNLKAQQLRYFQQDHLGSTAVITDEAGAVVERLAYDPWGKRRFPNGLPDPQDSIVPITTDRGYTEHEHLDEVGVIHMNGRIYDPLIGRFMSADPFIQAPFELQSHNRYAYVMNNPLGYTDPSGYFPSLGQMFQGLSDSTTSILRPLEPIAKVAVVVAAAYYTGQWAGANTLWGAVAGGAAGGFVGAAMGGANFEQSLKGGIIGGLSGALFFGAGQVGTLPTDYSRYAAHAAAGCVSSVAGGGKCGSGATAAVFGKWATNATANWEVGIAQGTAAVVAGGVGSVIGGGKFQNGAVTAAYGYLFNQASRLLRGAGHHKVTNEIARKYDWSGEALEVFDSLHGDGGGRIPVKGHNFGDGHSAYNRDAKDFVANHLESTKIEPNKMTTNEAKAMIKSMDAEPKLRNFNVRVYVNGVIKSMRMTTPKGVSD
jgi:RHS repeat-associated protein